LTTAELYYQPPVYPLSGKPAIPKDLISPGISFPAGSSVWPVHGKVFTEFGAPDLPWQARHTGIDISTARRAGISPVTVFREGIVIRTGPNGGFGNCVTVDHGGGLTSLYGHLQNITVTTGQHIGPGDTIGHEGSTGHSTGPHVHFEIQQNGRPVNPHDYVQGSP
jgi:murein DD-endopeptidase MepM/ murein hydrolase activator NlpD